jgi:hypothetical protein
MEHIYPKEKFGAAAAKCCRKNLKILKTGSKRVL